METVRLYEMPRCIMAVSKCGMFGDGALEAFDAWFSKLPRTMFPRNFLWYDRSRGDFVWYYMLDESIDAPSEFERIEFEGGLYAVATGIDGQSSDDVHAAIAEFIESHPGLERDDSREELGNIVTSPAGCAALGCNQMDYYVPVRAA